MPIKCTTRPLEFEGHGRRCYQRTYCARDEAENHIEEPQLDLFADHTSAHRLRAN